MNSRTELTLTPLERSMLAGDAGDAAALAMRIVVGLAYVLGARSLVPIVSAHVDGCLYHGQAGLDFVERLVRLGGQVGVPTTLNVGSLDLLHPGLVRGRDDDLRNARALMNGYQALGARPTWTCAPYQEADRPTSGQHVAWAESNAIAFVNSVLGARSDRYGDFIDICAGITGRAPMSGLHLDENRRAQLEFDCSALSRELFAIDAAWAALGHLVGAATGERVPVLTGVPAGAGEDALKAFGAAAASRGSVAMFHVVGVTPEAQTLADATGARAVDRVPVTPERLRQARDSLTSTRADRIDAVSVGTPHLSLAEFAMLAEMLADGAPVADGVEMWVSTSRSVLTAAQELGYAERCHAAGVRILVDTCTYVTSVLRPDSRVVMTNSAKWAWYAPVNLGVSVVFGTLSECVESARRGKVIRDDSAWR